MSRLPYPTEETKIARWPLLVRRARAMQRRELRAGLRRRPDATANNCGRGVSPIAAAEREYDRSGDWIEQASEAAACDIAPAREFRP